MYKATLDFKHGNFNGVWFKRGELFDLSEFKKDHIEELVRVGYLEYIPAKAEAPKAEAMEVHKKENKETKTTKELKVNRKKK